MVRAPNKKTQIAKDLTKSATNYFNNYHLMCHLFSQSRIRLHNSLIDNLTNCFCSITTVLYYPPPQKK